MAAVFNAAAQHLCQTQIIIYWTGVCEVHAFVIPLCPSVQPSSSTLPPQHHTQPEVISFWNLLCDLRAFKNPRVPLRIAAVFNAASCHHRTRHLPCPGVDVLEDPTRNFHVLQLLQRSVAVELQHCCMMLPHLSFTFCRGSSFPGSGTHSALCVLWELPTCPGVLRSYSSPLAWCHRTYWILSRELDKVDIYILPPCDLVSLSLVGLRACVCARMCVCSASVFTT
jgi:hypothetical protein